MSENSSNQIVLQRAKRGALSAITALGYSAWVLGSIFGIGALLAGVIFASGLRDIGVDPASTSSLVIMSLSIFTYLLGTAILLIEPYALRRMSWADIKKLLGLDRWPILRDLWYALLAWGGYMVLTVALHAIAVYVLPWVDFSQEQEIGFEALTTNLDILAAFAVIVVAAPIIEEVVFRGYLYGSVRRRMPWWLSAVVVSILFGFVHGQWNVGIDTFAMSMVACYLREISGSIWGAIALHSLKNSLAFYLLFVAPEWVRNLLMSA